MGHASPACATTALQCPGRLSPEPLRPHCLTPRPPSRSALPSSVLRASARLPVAEKPGSLPAGVWMLQAGQQARCRGKCP